MKTIEIQQLSKSFNSGKMLLPVFYDITLTVKSGEFVSLIGPSGAGKSTILKIVAGIDAPDSGEIKFDNNSDNGRDLTSNRKAIISYVPQHPALMPWLTVFQNVRFPLELVKMSKGDMIDNTLKALELVDMAAYANLLPHQLSGGMQQRVSLARALVSGPEVLLLDEPFSALDEVTRSNLQQVLWRICKSLNLTALMVTHSISEAVTLSDRVLVLSNKPTKIIAENSIALPIKNMERDTSCLAFFKSVQDIRKCLH
ncbi:MAG: ABC transporter ATP-binding protein [bacterium]|nr:ABC transporter ATP-binding protein [bacterium]